MVTEPDAPPRSSHRDDDEFVMSYADCDHRLEVHRWSEPLCEEISAAVDALAALDLSGDDDVVQLGRLRDVSRLIDRLEQRACTCSMTPTSGGP